MFALTNWQTDLDSENIIAIFLDKDQRLENPPKVCVCNHIWLSRNWIIGVLRDNIKAESADILVLQKHTLLALQVWNTYPTIGMSDSY